VLQRLRLRIQKLLEALRTDRGIQAVDFQALQTILCVSEIGEEPLKGIVALELAVGEDDTLEVRQRQTIVEILLANRVQIEVHFSKL